MLNIYPSTYPFAPVASIDALERQHGRQLIEFRHAPNVAAFGLRGWPDDLIYGCTDCGMLYPPGSDPDAGCPHCGLGQIEPNDEDTEEFDEDILEAAWSAPLNPP